MRHGLVGIALAVAAALAAGSEASLAQIVPPRSAGPQGAARPERPAAAAALIDAKDAAALADAMRNWGWLAKLTKDGSGDPKIESKVSKSSFNVIFYSCTGGADCGSITLSAGWNLKEKPFSMEAINKFNRQKRFGQASLDDEGDPHLSLSINLKGGVTPANLEDTFDFWRRTVTDFEKVINW